MSWQLLAVTAPLLFVAYQALSKVLSTSISPFLANAYASAMGVAVMLALYFLTSQNKSVAMDAKNLTLALSIGALVSIGNAAIIKAYALGAPQSAFTGTYYPALIIYGVAFGLLFWHERLTLYQAVGIALILVGVFLTFYFKQ